MPFLLSNNNHQKHKTMKRTFLIATAALLLLGITSCNKDQDGVYNPKKKISKIYCSYDYQDGDESSISAPRYMSEQWEWNGKQLLSRTLFDTDGSIDGKYTYTYEDKRLSRIDYTNMSPAAASSYTTFSYDGKELIQADFYYDGRLESTARFTHTDGKITAIDFSGELKGAIHNSNAMLNMIMPMEIQMSNAYRRLNAKKAMKSDKCRIEMTWTGKNISQMTSNAEGETLTYAFTYDDKKNPYYGMGVEWISALVEPEISEPELSVYDKNNVLTATYTSGLFRETATYTYTYKDDYPATCSIKDTYSDFVSTTRYEYEYLK